MYLPSVINIPDFAFQNISGLKTLSLPNATSIGQYCFSNVKNLGYICTPNVITIGDFAFANSAGFSTLDFLLVKMLFVM